MKSKSALHIFIIVVILFSMLALTSSSHPFVETVSAQKIKSEVQGNNNSLNELESRVSLDQDWLPLGTGLNGQVLAIAVSGTDVYVGGEFVNAGGIEAADYIARWDGNNWHALGSGLNAKVRAIAVDGSNIYVGGAFINVNGITSADKIARWDGSGWHALGSGMNQYTDEVHALAVAGTNLYVGGSFDNVDGIQDADNIARWDGTSWYALEGLYHELGASVVTAIATSGSDMYAGGNFTNASGVADADYIARWDGNGWHALDSGIKTYPSSVSAITADGNNIYVGGSFVNAGGNQDADKFARWDGSTWHVVGMSSPLYKVYSIAVDGTDIYIGGNATGNGFKQWDGVSWNILGTGLSYTPDVWAVAYDANYIYAGGGFTNAGGDPDGDMIARFPKEFVPINRYIYLPLVLKNE